MDKQKLKKVLSSLPIGELRYFESIDSTNDEALAWAANGAPDLSIVIADEQTNGRGRLNRKWITPKGSALAFSLILRQPDQAYLSRIVGLAALSIAFSCITRGLAPKIKWPNDILLDEKKAAGILIESSWSGVEVGCVIIGMGVNVAKGSIPPAELLQFPATSMEEAIGSSPDRVDFLKDILSSFIKLYGQIKSEQLIKQWEELLAYRGETVQIINNDKPIHSGTLIGLEQDGRLKILDRDNNIAIIDYGDVSLRPSV